MARFQNGSVVVSLGLDDVVLDGSGQLCWVWEIEIGTLAYPTMSFRFGPMKGGCFGFRVA